MTIRPLLVVAFLLGVVSHAPAGSKFELAVINPSLVLGPVCSKNVSSSIYIIARLLKGSDPSMP